MQVVHWRPKVKSKAWSPEPAWLDRSKVKIQTWSAAAIRDTLLRLREQLPNGRSLSELRIAADGGRIIVQDGGPPWNPESGQFVLDFEVSELATKLAPLAPRSPMPATGTISASTSRRTRRPKPLRRTAARYRDALAAGPRHALAAYRRAIAIDAGYADAHFNAARLYELRGDTAAALRYLKVYKTQLEGRASAKR